MHTIYYTFLALFSFYKNVLHFKSLGPETSAAPHVKSYTPSYFIFQSSSLLLPVPEVFILLSICTDNMPPYRHNGIFAQDICVLRIHSQGSVTRACVLPPHAEGDKPVVHRH